MKSNMDSEKPDKEQMIMMATGEIVKMPIIVYYFVSEHYLSDEPLKHRFRFFIRHISIALTKKEKS